jgi:putative Mg2+ transporter-C (MgtC) family protein
LGATVGIERERSERAAGLRTHAMVALGAAIFMLTSEFGFKDILGTSHVELDPSRVAAQVASGIGFLGAGIIIFQHEKIRGLTTAASIWAVAAIGLAVAGGLYVISITGTGLILGVLAGLKRAEIRWFKDRRSGLLKLRIDRNTTSIMEIQSRIEEQGMKVEQIIIMPSNSDIGDRLSLVLSRGDTKSRALLLDRLRLIKGVREINSDTPDARNL